MINRDGVLATVGKENLPKFFGFPKPICWAHGEYLCDCHTLYGVLFVFWYIATV